MIEPVIDALDYEVEPTSRGPRRGHTAAADSFRPLALLALIVGWSFVVSCGGPDQDLSPLAAQGRDVVRSSGCSSCHGPNGGGGVGPSWVGLAGSMVQLDDGAVVVADDEYLRRSILEPQAQTASGYTVKMPSAGLADSEIDAVIAYIGELK